MPMAMIALTALGPNTAVIMIAIRSAGKAKTRSLARMTISSSSAPCLAAASRPSGTPITMPMPTAIRATAMEIRAPIMTMEKMSRPKASVPNQWVVEGVFSLLAISSWVTS